ncbi:glycosyltransferase family 4 protein [Lactobacillus helveticus]|uniref:glycosyltransferase family 4 protein n=1 Tax=Lactobacillus helveticus TaxID=1587 RepID=UPI000B0C56C2|nr:glycosyltransferase family 4 protein [Lactobacillus helveticus]
MAIFNKCFLYADVGFWILIVKTVGVFMKIAMLGQKAVPSRLGGVEIVVENLATQMTRKKQDVTLYNRKVKGITPVKRYKGVKIHTVLTINKKGLAAISASFFAAIQASLNNYDIVHIHAEGPAFFSWIPKLFGKKVVVTIHGLDWKRAKWKKGLGSKFIKAGEKAAVKYSDAIIVLSKDNQDYFLKKYSRKTFLIPNGVHAPRILDTSLIQRKWKLQKDKYILYLGRIVPEKGIKNLILAFKKVKTDKKLVIAGGSSDTDQFYDELKKLAKDDPRILFTGAVQGRTLGELYSNAYLYTLPSDLEGMPLSLLEAMSYGNCVLVSDIPECTDVVEQNGIIFKHGNVKDLQDKLEYTVNHSNVVRKFKEKSSNYILSKYNWNKIVDKTLLVYGKCLND